MRIRTVDELRTELRLARQRFSPREIGRATGVSHTTINLLLSEREVPRPTTATIRKLSAWLDANGEDVPELVEATSVVDRPPGYWQGVAEAVLRMIDAAGVELQTLIDSGVLAPRHGMGGSALAGVAAGNGNGAIGRPPALGAASPVGVRGRRTAVGPREARRLRLRGPLLPPGAVRPTRE
jgi:transcriptional regulator with XRE-family HTH domain